MRYKCELCNHQATQKGNLTRHKEYVHGERMEMSLVKLVYQLQKREMLNKGSNWVIPKMSLS